jgi:hypothetical protein
MEVVFPFYKILKIDLDTTRVDLPMSFPAISLLVWVGVGGRGKLKIKLTQPQVELEAWLSLAIGFFLSCNPLCKAMLSIKEVKQLDSKELIRTFLICTEILKC